MDEQADQLAEQTDEIVKTKKAALEPGGARKDGRSRSRAREDVMAMATLVSA